jgi:hypothetical protein
MADQLDAGGNAGEAGEHRRLAQACTKLAHEMDLLAQAESTGDRSPDAATLQTGGDGVAPGEHLRLRRMLDAAGPSHEARQYP